MLRLYQIALIVMVILAACSQANAQWSRDPNINTPISTAEYGQFYPTIVSDDAGGAIITWYDHRSGTHYDIYAQRINANGEVQWMADGVGFSTQATDFPTITSDGAGGAIITWEDNRDSSSMIDIYAQRINTNGAVQWTAGGVAISTSANTQVLPTITGDGVGGAIIAWPDLRSGNADIYAQRINANGVVQWTANGVAISTAANVQIYPVLVSDGAGGAIITWYDHRSGTHDDIYAQRINANGVVQWTADGVAISTATSEPPGPAIMSDGAGGAIISWPDPRGGNADIFAQRINGNGVVQWTANSVAISTVAGDQSRPTITTDGAGGAIITWGDDYHTGNSDIHTQRINASGEVQWTASGVAISTAVNNQIDPAIASDDDGSAIITWHDFRGGTNWDIYAQRINASGELQWATDGVAISTAANNQIVPTITSDGAGGAIITWYDYRSSSIDIYAQRILSNGMLGTIPVPRNLTATPSNGQVFLSWSRNIDPYFLRYRVYSDTLIHPTTQIDSTIGGASDTLKVITGLNNGTTYYFRITAVDTAGFESGYSNEVAAAAGTLIFTVNNRWNMVSVPLSVADYSKVALFRAAISPAFAYEGAYVVKDTLVNGIGYWLKFSSIQYGSMSGSPRTRDTIEVQEGWNLIGSISTPQAVTDIISQPSSIVTSQFFGYNGRYFNTDTIVPGKGYWVKVHQKGELILSAFTGASSTNRIRIIPLPELPPPPPDPETTNLKSQIPTQFSLEQNYPNPFNSSTVIHYQLPVASSVSLRVYNVLGQQVSTLVAAEMQNAGYKHVTFEANGLASGVYFYRLQAGNFIETEKFVLLR